jgi:hypothetical protein
MISIGDCLEVWKHLSFTIDEWVQTDMRGQSESQLKVCYRSPAMMSVHQSNSRMHIQPLLMIRQISLRQKLPPDGACQEIDSAWASVQRCSLTAAQREPAVSVSDTVESLCIAAGVVLLYWNEVGQSSDFSTLLAGLKACVLREAAVTSKAVTDPSIISCCGVICSLLHSLNNIASLPRAVHSCVGAAVGEVIVQQSLAAGKQACRGQGVTHARAPILMYATSIFAAFSDCVLSAQTTAEIESLLSSLETSVAPVCLQEDGSSQLELLYDQRAVLQRAMVPVLNAIQSRISQLASAAAPPSQPTQPSSAQSIFLRLQQLSLHEHLSRLVATKWRIESSSHVTAAVQANESATIKVARVLSMVYHAPSRSSSPSLSSLVSDILGQLVQTDTSALQLAQHIIRPSCLHASSHEAGHRSTFLQIMHSAVNGRTADAGPTRGGTEFRPPTHQQLLQQQSGLHQQMTEQLLPALQCAGHWQSAACFMLTLLMPCLATEQFLCRHRDDIELWETLLNELLPILQALAISASSARFSLEAWMSLVEACPDAVPMKSHFCMCYTGVLCMHLAESDPDCLASALAGVSKYCKPVVATECCRLCCSITRVGADAEVQQYMIRALVSVVVHGSSQCLRPVLDLISMQLKSIGDGDKEQALSQVRHGLMHCHDFKKKPHCVRWFHALLAGLHSSKL